MRDDVLRILARALAVERDLDLAVGILQHVQMALVDHPQDQGGGEGVVLAVLAKSRQRIVRSDEIAVHRDVAPPGDVLRRHAEQALLRPFGDAARPGGVGLAADAEEGQEEDDDLADGLDDAPEALEGRKVSRVTVVIPRSEIGAFQRLVQVLLHCPYKQPSASRPYLALCLRVSCLSHRLC